MRLVAIILLLFGTLIAHPISNCLYMDGDGDYVELFEPILHKPPFTIEAWGNMFSPGGGVYAENVLFEQRNHTTISGASLVVFMAKNDTEQMTVLAVRDNFNQADKAKCKMQNYQEWHHYAGVVSENSVAIYMDGILLSQVPYTQSGFLDQDIDFISIGRHAFNGVVGGYFNGYIDEMRVWNYAKSAEQIQADLNKEIDLNNVTERSKLLAYWRFNDFYEFWKNGNQYIGVKDLSGNNHHGAFVDDATLVQPDEHLEELPLHQFALLAPLDGAVVSDSVVTFTWQSAVDKQNPQNGEVCYTLYISMNSYFSDPWIIETREQTSYVNSSDYLAYRLTYYWKVKAQNKVGEIVWSPVYKFECNPTRNVELISFNLLYPGYNITLYKTFTVLYWEKASSDTNLSDTELTYTIELSVSPDFSDDNSWTFKTFGEQSQLLVQDLHPGEIYFWRVTATNVVGGSRQSEQTFAFKVSEEATGVTEEEEQVNKFQLYANYPNPFNLSTLIKFILPSGGNADLTIYNLLGNQVAKLVSQYMPSGTHIIFWNGLNQTGDISPSGIYLYELNFTADNGMHFHNTKKLMLVK